MLRSVDESRAMPSSLKPSQTKPPLRAPATWVLSCVLLGLVAGQIVFVNPTRNQTTPPPPPPRESSWFIAWKKMWPRYFGLASHMALQPS